MSRLGVGGTGADVTWLGSRVPGDDTLGDDRLLLEARSTAGDTSVGDGTLLGPRMMLSGDDLSSDVLECAA